MPLDALFLRALTAELRCGLIGARIDKVHQPERDEITLALRTQRGNRRLLLSAAVGSARVHFIDDARENPATPPNFCMLLRKHIGGGRIAEVTEVPNERILCIEIAATDEFLEPVCRRIIIELIGSQPNIILLDHEGRILDAVRRIEGDIVTGKRQILPGLFYELPQKQEKMSIFDLGNCRKAVVETALPDTQIERFLLKHIAGISPAVAREIAFRAAGDVSAVLGGNEEKTLEILAILSSAFQAGSMCRRDERGISDTKTVADIELIPTLTLREGMPYDYSFLQLLQYENTAEYAEYDTYSELLQSFYNTRDKRERLRRRGKELSKIVTSSIERLEKKLTVQRSELADALNREQLRRFGDLIMANIHSIPRGIERISLPDFYDEEMKNIEVLLDVRQNPQQNAARYYKEYARKKNAEKILNVLISSGNDELYYLNSVKAELQSAQSEHDLQLIRDELEVAGILRKKLSKSKRSAVKHSNVIEYSTTNGFRVLVGRNNLDNDRLTFSESEKNDIWLHAQKSHGAHVILRTGGVEPDDESYTQAGMIAAYHSENRGAARVAVDYTRVKQVKKPAGAKPGMVIYEQYFTMYVQSDEALLKTLLVKN